MAEDQVQNKIQKLPPQSIEAEQAVLGALLVNNVAITRVVDILKPENFYRQAHKHIYSVMVSLFNKSEPIDVVTVSEHLRDQDKLELVGGRAAVNDLALSVITTANIEYYARIVAEKSTLRELIKAGTEIVSIAFDENNTDKVMDTAEKLIFAISQKTVADDLMHIKEIVVQSYEQIETRYNNRDEIIGVPSGFYDLDNMTAGFQPSDLIIVAARPSMGKTAFCLNIAQEVAIRRKKPVAVFSLEMSKEQLVQRMLCSEAEIDSNRLRTGHMQTEDWSKLTTAMGLLGEAPIFIDDSAGIGVMEVRAKCRRLRMEHKDLSLIIIDYLQLMEGTGSGRLDRVHEISAISRGLKNLARELKVPIIALSQLSRAVESRTIKKPMLSDLRESGSIEQDADIVMFIYREDYYDPENADKKGKAEIIISKQRNGPVGSVELLFQSNITKFKNQTATKTHVF
ncbi:MAG: replicative DNA helicase [Candidatus Gastranaerophilales bacterium]|nr:replicative DNA helicase [Candidatus Gastranaerophilales bacterium]